MLATAKSRTIDQKPTAVQGRETDRDLVRAYRDGDDGAFQRLHERYERPIKYYLVELCRGDRHRADDIAQDTFIKLARWAESNEEIKHAGLSPFIHTIAKRTWLDELRSGKRHRSRCFADGPAFDGEEPSYDPPDTHIVSPDDSVAGMELLSMEKEVLQEAIDRAYPHQCNQRQAILMRLAGCSYNEIQSALDIPLGTVKSSLNAAFLNVKGAINSDPRLRERAEEIRECDPSTLDNAA